MLCCGGAVGGFFYLKNQVFNFSSDPVEVAKVSRGIAEIDMPPGFKPVMSMKFNIAGTGMTMAAYAADNNEGGLFLMEVSGQNAGADPEVLRAQMEAQMKAQQGGHGSRQIKDLETRPPVEVEIRGKPATFKIQKGTDAQSNKEFTQVMGTFEGKEGTDMLFMQLPSDKYSDEQVEKIIRSIK
ncbi:MAG TPA: hypothetical protein VGX76_11415 [Pirellulales bacterium]|nr:hypothetical protein [Pirellulales bacterium]